MKLLTSTAALRRSGPTTASRPGWSRRRGPRGSCSSAEATRCWPARRPRTRYPYRADLGTLARSTAKALRAAGAARCGSGTTPLCSRVRRSARGGSRPRPDGMSAPIWRCGSTRAGPAARAAEPVEAAADVRRRSRADRREASSGRRLTPGAAGRRRIPGRPCAARPSPRSCSTWSRSATTRAPRCCPVRSRSSPACPGSFEGGAVAVCGCWAARRHPAGSPDLRRQRPVPHNRLGPARCWRDARRLDGRAPGLRSVWSTPVAGFTGSWPSASTGATRPASVGAGEDRDADRGARPGRHVTTATARS